MSSVHIRKYLASSSFRYALITMLVIWICLAVVIASLYLLMQRSIWRALEWQLNSEEEMIFQIANEYPTRDLSELMPLLDLNPDTYLHLVDPYSESDEQLARILRDSTQKLYGSESRSDERYYDFEKNLITRTIELPSGNTVLLVRRVNWLHDLGQAISESLMFGIVLTFILSIFASFILSRRSLSRIQQINESCNTIMNGDLSYRIPLRDPNKPDDYDAMSKNINSMLDRIQSLMDQVKQVSNNIAHDLRSPLARLRSKVEGLKIENKEIETDGILQEADRLLDMFNGLLKIAQLESQVLSVSESINLKTLLDDVCEFFSLSFEEKKIEFEIVTTDIKVIGDPNLLFQAFSNLFDNALKYTTLGGCVSLFTMVQGANCIIKLQNSSPGIPESERERIFDKFVRLDDARSLPGFGLGLSQVRAIVELHRGRIVIEGEDIFQVKIMLPIK